MTLANAYQSCVDLFEDYYEHIYRLTAHAAGVGADKEVPPFSASALQDRVARPLSKQSPVFHTTFSDSALLLLAAQNRAQWLVRGLLNNVNTSSIMRCPLMQRQVPLHHKWKTCNIPTE